MDIKETEFKCWDQTELVLGKLQRKAFVKTKINVSPKDKSSEYFKADEQL